MTKDTATIEASLDTAQNYGFDQETPEAAMLPFLNFTTREEYLAWRGAWRARINQITSDSRLARSLHRRENALDKEAATCLDPERFTLLLSESREAYAERSKLGSRALRREQATSLLALRRASKREAGRQWQAARVSVEGQRVSVAA